MSESLKKTAICICLILFSISLTGCQKYDVERITLEIYAGDVPAVSVYIFTPDLKVIAYDFYYEDRFDFSSDPWPELYDVEEYSISQDEWDNIVKVLQGNDFMNLREEINASTKIMDGGNCYIEVAANRKTHRSGGYMPKDSWSLAGIRFENVYDAIYGCLD